MKKNVPFQAGQQKRLCFRREDKEQDKSKTGGFVFGGGATLSPSSLYDHLLKLNLVVLKVKTTFKKWPLSVTVDAIAR